MQQISKSINQKWVKQLLRNMLSGTYREWGHQSASQLTWFQRFVVVSAFIPKLHLISAFVTAVYQKPFSAAVFFCRRWGEATGINWNDRDPLHTPFYIIFAFPFYKPLISLPLPSLTRPVSLSLSLSLSNPSSLPSSRLIFSNLLRFPHLPLPFRCLPPSPQSLGRFEVTQSGMWGVGLM